MWLLALGACGRPHFDGPPILEVGTGEYRFEPVVDGQEVPIVSGPQGGEHVWLGLRAWEVDPRGVHLEAELTRVGDGVLLGAPLIFDVRLFEGDDGSLEYAGLPLQFLPADVQGRRMRVEVWATDRWGREASDAVEVIPRWPE